MIRIGRKVEKMVEKSQFLEDVTHKAQELSGDIGGNITQEAFVVALLEVIQNGFSGSNYQYELEEVLAVNKMLNERIVGLKEKGTLAIRETFAEEMKNMTELEIKLSYEGFRLFQLRAEFQIRREGKEKIGADMLLNYILQKPSRMIGKYVKPEEEAAVPPPFVVPPTSTTSPKTEETPAEQEEEKKKPQGGFDLSAMLAHFKAQQAAEEKKESEEKKTSSEDDDDISDIFDFLDDDDDDEEEPEKPVEQEREPSEVLTEIVQKSKNLQNTLLSKIYGQDQAINTFVSGYFQTELQALAKSNPNRPRATFLFAGPPGVGKTFLSEQAAEALKLPFKRFDMSEYADKEANIEFCGSDKVYKNGKAGNVTQFVAENPQCILLFDEVEKAHLTVIYLFLQMLDAGRLRDNYTDEEVSFEDAIIIFTTNAGKELYEDPTIVNLSATSRKSILNAIGKDVNPNTGAPLFPAAICSRFASGNVVMFNRLTAQHLLKVVHGELKKNATPFTERTKVALNFDKNVDYAVLFAEGSKADARTVRGRSTVFLYQELYELFRLTDSTKNNHNLAAIERIDVTVALPESGSIRDMFEDVQNPEVLVFASEADYPQAKAKAAQQNVILHFVDSVDEAKAIIAKTNICIILCDIQCRQTGSRTNVLNVEDVASEGSEFFAYATEYLNLPIYLLQHKADELSPEEFLSFAGKGARGVIAEEETDFAEKLKEECNIADQQNKMVELARSNRVLAYKTMQNISEDGKVATITLYDLTLSVAVDAGDNQELLSGVSRPTTRFDDVIGAKDAKDELRYFVDYLKNPTKYLRTGLRAPKGILLYGPPGTGKTLLAKAMAGESDVTFISAEGNQFLKGTVGKGPEAVHNLFTLARKYAPSIVFIDEIDAIAMSRESDAAKHTADVLTAFLTEMDGFRTKADKPVFVLAATNYSVEAKGERALDAALMRRFDRKLLVDLPDKEERKQFIRMKIEKNAALKLSEDQIENIAVRSTSMSLADLESIFELALRNAIKSKDFTVNDEICEDAFETYCSGEVKQWAASELERTARHEAGHALLCWLYGAKPSYLTIVARGSHGGYMQHGDSEQKGLYTKEELLSRIRISLAGRAAEIVYYGEEDGISTGASGDLYTATSVAEAMICSYGMDETVGFSSVDLAAIQGSPYYQTIRVRVNEILSTEFEKAKKVISTNRAAVDKLVEILLMKNNMKGSEIDEVLQEYVVEE